MVRNNLSIRIHSIESMGIGLRSIKSPYQLLNHEASTIRQDAEFFCVIIPLIPSGDVPAAIR